MAFENYEVLHEELPAISDVGYYPHPTALRTKQLVNASIVLFILLIPMIVFLITGITLGILISAGAWILIASIIFISVMKSFPHRGYALRQRDITYRKGWIFRKRTTIPFNRIQHSEIEQGPMDRKFNLSSLKIFTAGGSSSDLVIPGLYPDEAKRLHEFISEQTTSHD